MAFDLSVLPSFEYICQFARHTYHTLIFRAAHIFEAGLKISNVDSHEKEADLNHLLSDISALFLSNVSFIKIRLIIFFKTYSI